jgi:hypothetical protein
MPTPSIARASKIYPNLDFWLENKPSGNPGLNSQLGVNNDLTRIRSISSAGLLLS